MEKITSCKYCNVINSADQVDLFDTNEVNKILRDIYSGEISITKLDESSYKKIAEKLTNGVYEGFGKTLGQTGFGSPEHNMLKSLRENVYVFSAAKSYQQTKEISSLITNEKGLVPYNQFKKEASKVFDTYNKHYLSAEYNSAIAQSRSASMWMDFESQKGVYNQLQYHTVGDARVRYDHRVLENIIRPVDDKFWSIYMPPNGWNCRCTVLQVDGEVNTDLSKKTPPTKKEVPELFRFNAGKEKVIFNKAHPYFQVDKEDKGLALKNFNLPLPKEIKIEGFKPAKTTEEVEQRLQEIGVKNVSLKGLKPDTANAVLQAVEKEASYGNFKLNSISTFRSAGNNGKALYSPSQNAITINLSHLKAEKQILLSYEEQLIREKGVLQKFKEDYLGKPQYKQSTVYARMNSIKNRIWDIEQKMAKGEKARYWSVSSQYESASESLKATTTHELGHYRHFKTLNESSDFSFRKENSISEYGRTNSKEYLAEWFTHYRLNGEAGVPADLLKLFKTIDNGKF
jgi:SPP1 gp7 family putative phage head morphogenesis protein